MKYHLLLSENCSQGTFNKFNLEGVHFPAEISLPSFPYSLHSNIVLLAEFDEPISGEIRVIFETFDENNQSVLKIGGRNLISETQLNVSLIAPISFEILSVGTLVAQIFIDKYRFEQRWLIKLGDGPFHARTDRPMTGGVLGLNSTALDIKSFLARATTSLTVIDPFLTDIAFQNIFTDVGANIEIKILTGLRQLTDYRNSISAIETKFSNISIRASSTFHDRFVILNGNEVFAFGYSLKDISLPRISYFTKLFDLEEHEAVIDAFDNDWPLATTLW